LTQCRIDFRPAFLRIVATQQRQYPQVNKDLKDLFEHVVQAPTKAAGARRYELGYDDYEAYTYDCKSTDMRKGAKNAFRVVAAYEKKTNVVTPISMFYKGDLEYMPADEVFRAIESIKAATEPEPPSVQ
jgi:hypothetical protein